ncbi:MAG: hypothetical protein WAN30_10035 [Acidimicrobiales bacterium]
MTNYYSLLRRRASSRRHARALVTISVGAALIVVTSYVHWHLWGALGYRHVPTIGWLFLVQSITGLIIALALVLLRELWLALVADGFVASTLVGFLISVTHGLFGFHDSWYAPYARLAFGVEVAALVVLSAGALLIGRDSRASSSSSVR